MEKFRLERLIPSFHIKDTKLLYNKKVCIPQESVPSNLLIAHNIKIGDYFKFERNYVPIGQFS